MKKNVAIVMVITIFSKFFGFFREVALSYYYGAGPVTDAYLTAMVIPGVLFTLVGTGLSTTFIPIFNKIMTKEGEKEANVFTSNIINIVLVFATIIVLLVMLFTKPVIMLFAPGFIKSPESLSLAIQFTRISIFGVYFSGIIYIFNSFLQTKNSFLIPAMLGIPMNFVTIISYVIASKTSDNILAYGIVISMVLQVLILIPAAIKLHFKYTFKLDFKDKYIRQMLFLAIPVFIGSSVNQLNTIVDKNMASRLQTGTISALNYSNKLNGFIQGLFVMPIATVMYPTISKMAIDKNEKGLKNTINKSVILISLFVIPATIGAMLLSKPIVDLLFLRGEFTQAASLMTSKALFYYSIGMLFFALSMIFGRVFYSYNDTKTPMVIGIIGVVINIVLNILLIGPLGIGGLALATSLSSAASTSILILRLRKKIPSFGFKEVLGKMIKITLASLIMGAEVYLSFNYFNSFMSQNLSAILSIATGGIVYLGIILVIGIDEVKDVIEMAKARIGKK
ncbi:MAG: murein biosynthesis integral membrane protein MurJ [Clostridium sp.]|nr:murein biosynthesis integral membrane protein MurJ [Clostridium sp.]